MRGPRRWRRRTRTLVLSLLGVMAASAIFGTLWFYQDVSAGDRAAEARVAAVAVAQEHVPRMLSYTPENVDGTLADAANYLTGQFKDQFTELSTGVIAPTSRDKGVTTEASIIETSVVTADEDSVRLLLFVNQSTTTTAQPAPALVGSRVSVTLTQSDDGWKISDLQPV